MYCINCEPIKFCICLILHGILREHLIVGLHFLVGLVFRYLSVHWSLYICLSVRRLCEMASCYLFFASSGFDLYFSCGYFIHNRSSQEFYIPVHESLRKTLQLKKKTITKVQKCPSAKVEVSFLVNATL